MLSDVGRVFPSSLWREHGTDLGTTCCLEGASECPCRGLTGFVCVGVDHHAVGRGCQPDHELRILG